MFIDIFFYLGLPVALYAAWWTLHNELDLISFEYQLAWTRYQARHRRFNKRR